MKATEHQYQVALFNWAAWLAQTKYPELALMFAIPNAGKRSLRQGMWMKQEGLRAGTPDIFLPVSRGKYHGMFIEMKSDKGRLSPAQQEVLPKLKKQGYYVIVSHSAIEAEDEIEKYLNGDA